MAMGLRRRRTLIAAVCAAWTLAALPCLADTLRGTIRSVSPRERRLVVQDADGDDNHLRVARTARIVLNGKAAALDDLQPGDRVVVTFAEGSKGAATASAITARRGK